MGRDQLTQVSVTSLVSGGGVTVYNCVSGDANPVTWGRSTGLWVQAVRRRPYSSTRSFPEASFTLSRLYYGLASTLGLGLPAHCGDLLARLQGNKSR